MRSATPLQSPAAAEPLAFEKLGSIWLPQADLHPEIADIPKRWTPKFKSSLGVAKIGLDGTLELVCVGC